MQSWSEGIGNDLPSFCGPPAAAFPSKNVEHISIPGTSLAWPTRHAFDRDHGKWAVTISGYDAISSTGGTFCIADQNRARTQEVRGGTAVCFMDNVPLWEAFSNSVDLIEECNAYD